jgi:hypothetical protein
LEELATLGIEPLKFQNSFGLPLDRQKYNLMMKLIDGSAFEDEFEGIEFHSGSDVARRLKLTNQAVFALSVRHY